MSQQCFFSLFFCFFSIHLPDHVTEPYVPIIAAIQNSYFTAYDTCCYSHFLTTCQFRSSQFNFFDIMSVVQLLMTRQSQSITNHLLINGEEYQTSITTNFLFQPLRDIKATAWIQNNKAFCFQPFRDTKVTAWIQNNKAIFKISNPSYACLILPIKVKLSFLECKFQEYDYFWHHH